uniref:Uncharacterized protein n=1 Tax=Wuchereria bancrofti TaxID=6293 RepID=A0AAF5PXA7_WUCBA
MVELKLVYQKSRILNYIQLQTYYCFAIFLNCKLSTSIIAPCFIGKEKMPGIKGSKDNLVV